MEAITSEQLRNYQQLRKEKDLRRTVEHIVNVFVIPAAEAGETRVIISENKYPHLLPVKFPPSFALLFEALQVKFPDVSVTAGTQTTICDNGIFEKKTHIVMDWSSVASS
jgi:hypothetical protein